MSRSRKIKSEAQRREPVATLIILIKPECHRSSRMDAEYHRSFLRQRLIRGWIAIFASLMALALLATSVLDRIL
jgi:hypothetical protein